MNNCVGKRNYRFFICFVGSIFLTCLAFIVNLVMYFVAKSGSIVNSTVLIVVCSVIVAIVGLPLQVKLRDKLLNQ